MSLKDKAKGHWKSILSGIIGEEYFSGKHGPCPICEKMSGDGGKDRFRFDDKAGSGHYFCNQCGNGQGIDLLALHQGLTHSDAWKLVEKLLPTAELEEPKKKADYSKLIEKLNKQSFLVTPDTEVYRYLYGRLAHILKRTGEKLIVPPAIRQVKYVDYADPAKPVYNAMVCRVEKNKKLVGLHVTLLKDNKKAPIESPRRLLAMYEGALNGAAIPLKTTYKDSPLILAEGVETALAASILFGFSAWATINSTLMPQVEVPGEIEQLVIAGDNDPKFGGQAAAYAVAHKYAVRGKQVKIKIPPKAGLDWASPELFSEELSKQ